MIKFKGEYFEHVEKVIETKLFPIIVCESSFLSYLVSYYIFNKNNTQFKELLWRQTYRYLRVRDKIGNKEMERKNPR